MTREFAKHVDRIMLEVLRIQDQIRDNRGNDPDPEVLHQRLHLMFDDAERELGKRYEEWHLARFALAAWIDEILNNAPWEHRSYWANHTLQFDFEQRQDGREEFFRRAEEAARLPNKDALEVFFMCVVLQFKGVYDEMPGLATPADVDLPGGGHLPRRIQDWVRKMRQWISARNPPVVAGRLRNEDHEAPPLKARFSLLAMTLLLLTVLAATAFLWSITAQKGFAPPT
jgi:type VI secretion system protein ImpK